jgi:hypothetical protein
MHSVSLPLLLFDENAFGGGGLCSFLRKKSVSRGKAFTIKTRERESLGSMNKKELY